MDGSVCVSDLKTGETRRLTQPVNDESSPRPEACVFSPDGQKVAFVRRVREAGNTSNQVFIVSSTAGR
jgi:tricorn protease-like protein